ncbi:MAG: PDDEXK nuclease domain-containing protein [Victivallaceae bacterium]|nr:PDDEXK nuclease domain-containing protein [Victivallaceae bacterium]
MGQTLGKRLPGRRQRHVDFQISRVLHAPGSLTGYNTLISGIGNLLEQSRRYVVRTINSVLPATYWEIGHRIVEFEQNGEARAEYGEELMIRLARDLTTKYGRGFAKSNLFQMRAFYLGWEIFQTASGIFEIHSRTLSPTGKPQKTIVQTTSGKSEFPMPASAEWNVRMLSAFPLSWSHYVRLLSVDNPQARTFYETEAIRGGWSVRQLDRQIGTQFYERTIKSRNRESMLVHGGLAKPEDAVSLQEEIRDPYLLEFLNLKDEYSESDLEDAIIRHLEWFLLELGSGFTFMARQKRIRIGDEWYRIDLLLFHRRLRCLVVIDLKIGKFTHADAGQMNLYLNYARENLMEAGENEPVGLILCSEKNDAVVHYAMGGIKAKVFASRYMTALPDEETLRKEILITQRAVKARLTDDKTGIESLNPESLK